MATPLPPMSPIRTIVGGEVVPPAEGPVVQSIVRSSQEVEAGHRAAADARKAEEGFSLAPSRIIISGQEVAREAPPYTPAAPQETPVQVHLNGEPLDRSAAPAAEPAMDPGMEQYLSEKGEWLAWMDAFPTRRYGGTADADWKDYTRAQNVFLHRWRLREREGRLLLADFEAPAMPTAPKPKA
jgi:hypothetical protein